jgi:uncharacterized cupredoxin-like copper-binding protein
MKNNSNSLRLIAFFLVTFLVVVGISIWLLDFIAQQRVFGFLVSAELVAFALLVYLYYEENPADIDRKLLLGGFAAIGVLVLLGAAVFAGVGTTAPLPTPIVSLTPNVSITLYAGDVTLSEYGFGNSSASITSPGPTLTFTVGDVVNVTVFNAGTMPHNWALVSTNQTSAKVLFGAQIDSGSVPIEVNQTGSVVFEVTKSGDFDYICQVPGHVQSGMWGSVVINP